VSRDGLFDQPPADPGVQGWRRRYDSLLRRYSELPPGRPGPPQGNDVRGLLAWGHSHCLESLLLMYEATGATTYLDLFLSYGDGVLAARDTERGVPSSPDGRREPAWRSLYGFSQSWLRLHDPDGYPVFRLQCRPMGGPNRPTRASVVPRDDLFDLEVTRGDGAVDRLAGLSADPGHVRYAPRLVRTMSTLSRVTVRELRDRPDPSTVLRPAREKVMAPQPYVHPSHTGAIVTPLAGFARLVATTPALAAVPRYAAAARRYRDAAVAALEVHEREWREDPSTGEGWYVFLRGDPWYLDGTELPLNEFMTLAKAYGELARLPGADPAWARRTRAMARAFTNALRLDRTRDAYVWTYELPRSLMYRGWGAAHDVSDHNPVQPPKQVVEDLKHATLDLEVAFFLADRGYLTPRDARRFAHTFTRVMAKGSGRWARVAANVDGSGPASRNPLAMLFLGAARWDPAVYPHVRSMVQHREAPLPAMGAYLHGLAWLARAARGW
jgi:hypothetical protein